MSEAIYYSYHIREFFKVRALNFLTHFGTNTFWKLIIITITIIILLLLLLLLLFILNAFFDTIICQAFNLRTEEGEGLCASLYRCYVLD